jgi:hypothetical protein
MEGARYSFSLRHSISKIRTRVWRQEEWSFFTWAASATSWLVSQGHVQQDPHKDGRSNRFLTSRSLLMGHPKLSNGRGQAELIFVTQEGHHAIRALPPDSRDQKAAHPVFRCVASTEGFLGQQLWRLCGSEPTPGDGGGAYLPFIIERSRLAIRSYARDG